LAINDVETAIKKHLLLVDPYIVKLLVATTLINQYTEMNPVWLFLVAPPASGKSELLQGIAGVGHSEELDDLTAKSLMSAVKTKDGKSNSLLINLAISNIRTLIVKDFTVILSKEEQETREIFGKLRMVYDGNFRAKTGNDEIINGVKPHFGIIAGCTEEIFVQASKLSAMGERFLYHELAELSDLQAEEAAFLATSDRNSKAKSSAIREAFTEYTNELIANKPSTPPVLTDEVRRKIAKLAGFSTKAQTPITRDKYDKNRIVHINNRNMPARMAGQLTDLASALVMVNMHDTGEAILTPTDLKLLWNLCFTSIPQMRRKILSAWTKTPYMDKRYMTENLPASAEMAVQDLIALGIGYVTKDYDKSGVRFQRDERINTLITEYMGIKASDTDIMAAPTPPPTEVEEEEEFLQQAWDLQNTTLY